MGWRDDAGGLVLPPSTLSLSAGGGLVDIVPETLSFPSFTPSHHNHHPPSNQTNPQSPQGQQKFDDQCDLRFAPNDAGGWNIRGSGHNKFGTYQVGMSVCIRWFGWIGWWVAWWVLPACSSCAPHTHPPKIQTMTHNPQVSGTVQAPNPRGFLEMELFRLFDHILNPPLFPVGA